MPRSFPGSARPIQRQDVLGGIREPRRGRDYFREVGESPRGLPKSPLFRALDSQRRLAERRMKREVVFRMVRWRTRQADLPDNICCHTFRATGITAYLENGGTIENAQRIAAHESPRTTKLYDRTGDEISLDEIERILI